MFDFVRNHSRLTLGFLLLLIIPSFVVFGIEGYSRFTGAGNETVAKVAGQSVTRAEWEQTHDRMADRMRRDPQQEAARLNTPEARLDTLDALVRERVMLAAAMDQSLTPGEARLRRLFDADPQYASLRGPDGRLNRDMLVGMGMTPAVLEQRLRQEYAMRQVLGGVATSALAGAATADQALEALLQQREVQFQRYDIAAYRAKVNPSDADVEAYYKAHAAQFSLPEQAQIEYIVLDQEALAASITIADDEVKKFYEANGARFTAAEERRASHILVKADKSAPAAERAAAKAKAQSLLEQARKNPASFAELARKNSDDTGSAKQGGDLDFFARGAMVKPFEDAAYALKPGEISEVVESDFGFHVIQLAAVRGGQKKTLDEVRAEIVAELRKGQVAKSWSATAEQFNDMAYQHSETLQPLIDKFKLAKKAASVQRKPQPGAAGVLASPKLLDAVFGADALKNKRNTDAIEVTPTQLAVGRVLQHQPSRVPPLAEIKDRARERTVADMAAALARKEGEARLAALRNAPNESLPEKVTLSRLQNMGAPKPLLDQVMFADPAKLPQLGGVDLGDAGYVVYRVTRIVPRDVPSGGPDPMRQQFAQAFAAAESEAYLEALKRRYKVEIKPAARTAAAAAAASVPSGS